MKSDRRWSPLLDGDPAREAWQAIRDVATAIGEPGRATQQARDAALAGGSAGLALLFSYLAEASSDESYADVAMSYLEPSMEALAQFPMVPSLYEGFTGIGWTVAHLEGRLIESAEDDAYQMIDEALLELLSHPASLRDFDLISGLAGYAVYALEGLQRPAARSCLELLVAGLAASADGLATGAAWLTPPERLPDHQRELAPKGYYNLGVAHGLPAVVAVLGRICGAGVALGTARPLLDRAVGFLLSQEREGTESCFPLWVGEDADVRSARLAWCYGDPGVAATLLVAARSVGSEEWEHAARRIARRAAGRRFEGSAVQDAGLCHGAAGLGHLFNRLYQATGDESLAAAASFWFLKTLEMRCPGEGVAGFRSWRPDDEGTLGWRAEKGFLTGAAGVALALLGAVTPLEPQWDRVLLTSASR